ncbi:MAG: peptidylprolyl isomerase [Ignavibacteria bacterium]|nr:peptidylprolyl isomerase [Ignavibacteria bacterium]
MKLIKLFLFPIILISLYFPINGFAQQEGDRILAVVGNEIILESDLQYQLSLYARQNKLTQIPPALAQEIFNSLITDKIILAKAQQDSIEVSDEEVTKELDNRIKSLIEQVGSQSRLEEIYAMSIVKIRMLLKEDLKKRMMTERLKRQKFGSGVKSTDREVREFYKTYRDSLPRATEEFEIAHIYIERKVSDAEKNWAKDKAKQILDSVKKGVDFSELAKRNSDDSLSAIQGGNLGYVKKGSFVKPFEEAALVLLPGEVSDLVETQFGYHIIKLIDKKGDGFTTQHILVKFPTFESSDLETIKFLTDLKGKIQSGQITFDDAAKEYSKDESTKLKGGYIGPIGTEQLDSAVIERINSVSIGGITDPVRITTNGTDFGYEIIKVISKTPEHALTIEGDYEKIKRLADQYKEGKELDKWINDMRESIYIDTRF